ncbi:MAG: hypothetical protein U5Q44_12220 [Dehalococcoidia bacterium]|nr:hypothetical protein [Dehalococcoidia bacterium]
MLRRLALGLLLGALPLAACGAEPTLPEEGECPTPPAEATDTSDAEAYREAATRALDRVSSLDQEFMATWDNRDIRELSSFREDYALYSHLMLCATEVALGLDEPTARFETYHERFTEHFQRLNAAMEQGREATASRNRSDYEDWQDEIEELMDENRTLAAELQAM